MRKKFGNIRIMWKQILGLCGRNIKIMWKEIRIMWMSIFCRKFSPSVVLPFLKTYSSPPGGMHGHERRKTILDAVIINEMHAAQTSP
jgi:hypothetical protein